MESLPPVNLGAVILSAFLLVFILRKGFQDYFVLKARVVFRPRKQFVLELMLCLMAGALTAVFNMVVYDFPLITAFNLLSGVVASGFFLSLDMALGRERLMILGARENGESEARLQHLNPMSRVFLMIAIITSVFFAMVLVLVLIRDVNWLAGIAGSPEEVMQAEATVAYEILFIVAVLMGLVINIIYSYSRNLKLLFQNQTAVLERVSHGDFTQKVPVVTANEFGVIAGYTNSMIDGLEHRIALLSALKVAEEVQKNLLPHQPPKVPGTVVAATSIYSDETGGDYYDFFSPTNGDLVAVIGDISGHGIGAALLMSEARAILRMALDRQVDLPRITSEVNSRLAKDIGETGSFLTLFIVLIDPRAKTLTWVRGGHDPALLFDPVNDNFRELGGGGPALGLSENIPFESESLEGWSSGSILVLATDGIWETHNPQGEMFGKTRLKEIIKKYAELHPQKAIDAVFASLKEFRGNTPQEDDVTLVLIKLT